MQLTFALFKLAFAAAPTLEKVLTSLHNATRRPVLQKVRDHALNLKFRNALSACKHMVSGSLSLPSRGSFHLSLTVLCVIGHWIVFSLGGWSLLLPTGFLVSCGTLVSACRFNLSDTGLLPSLEVLSRTLLLDFLVRSADPQPHPTVVGWFGLLRFRSPLLTKSMFLSFPPGT